MIAHAMRGARLSHLLGLAIGFRPLCEERALAISWLRRELLATGDGETDVVVSEPVTAADLIGFCACEVKA